MPGRPGIWIGPGPGIPPTSLGRPTFGALCRGSSSSVSPSDPSYDDPSSEQLPSDLSLPCSLSVGWGEGGKVNTPPPGAIKGPDPPGPG
jgi:hypothetical protein